MNIEIIRSKRKTMAIHVRDGKVIVKAPLGVSDRVIMDFVDKKQAWIHKHLETYEPMGYHHGETKKLRVFGVYKDITFEEGAKFAITEYPNLIHLSIPQTLAFDKINDRVDQFFKNQLELRLQSLVCFYAWRLKLKTPPFKVRRYKRLYGRCNQQHELAFNTYLYHESIPFIHYVVLHECAHIIEFNHSARFYEVVESVMPAYKAIIRSNKLRQDFHQDL